MSDDPETAGKHWSSEQAILRELLAARRRAFGLSPREMSNSPVMAALLGNGDPEVAHVELGHKLLEIIETEDDITAIEAATFSLGYASDADTHLRRLEEFGARHHLDQRQARRYSDRGLQQLARLISTHWTTQTVPEATLIIIGVPQSQVGFGARLRRQRHIDMRPPELSTWPASAGERISLEAEWHDTHNEKDGPWIERETAPQVIDVPVQTTLRLLWRGETWPKFTTVLTGDIDADMVTIETLAAACAVTIRPAT